MQASPADTGPALGNGEVDGRVTVTCSSDGQEQQALENRDTGFARLHTALVRIVGWEKERKQVAYNKRPEPLVLINSDHIKKVFSCR